jgi:anti-sigma regulatory factor (Ser/Thr protein kinase)
MRGVHVEGSQNLGHWRVSATPASVPALRREVRSAIRDRGFDEAAVGLAISEALTNVVTHAYSESNGPVAVQLEIRDGVLVVTVADEGAGLESLAASSHSERGLGLALIHAVTDDVKVEPTSTGTIVRMVFRRPQADVA